MIFKTPQLSKEVIDLINQDQEKSIKSYHPEFESCFLCFNPFLKAKNDFYLSEDNFPSKSQIIENYEILNWSEFINITSITDIKSLDRVLGFHHTAIAKAEKTEYNKFKAFIERNEKTIIPAYVDEICPILEFRILNYLQDSNIHEIYIYSDIEEKSGLIKTTDALNQLEDIPFQPRITDEHNTLLIEQDFDERFFYIYSSKEFIDQIVTTLELEGFYCDENTPIYWSKDDSQIKEPIDWSEL